MRCPERGSTRIDAGTNEELEHIGGPRLFGRLGRAQRHAQEASASERRWIDAAQQTRRAGTEMQCPRDVPEEAARLLRRAQRAGITQGRDLRAMGAASLLASCRRLHFARTEGQVAQATGIGRPQLRSAYRALTRGLGLKVPKLTAHEHLAQIASRLRVAPEVESDARRILAPVCGTHLAASRSPLGWAAAALVLASKRRGQVISVNRAALAARVSNSTVALRIQDLERLPAPLSSI